MSVNVLFTTVTSSNFYPSATQTLYNSLVIDGVVYSSPVSLSFSIGSTHTIQANDNSQNFVGDLWNWVQWSDNGLRNHTISANGGTTSYTASFTLNPQIYADIDPLVFVLTNFSSTVQDDNGNNVPFTTQYPDAIMNQAIYNNINVFPIISLNPNNYTTEWAAIGAFRLRYYQDIEMIIWATSPGQRFAIENSLRKQTTTINKTQLAVNYVFMYFPYNGYADEVNIFGSPLYRVKLPLRLIYDVIRPV